MRGQNVQKMLEREHFWRIFHGILSELGPKVRFFSGASRAVNNSLTTTWLTSTIRSKSRLFYNNAWWKMSKAHQKTHESHPGRQARTHTTKNNVFRSVLEIVFWCRPHRFFNGVGVAKERPLHCAEQDLKHWRTANLTLSNDISVLITFCSSVVSFFKWGAFLTNFQDFL